jgi:hypothetical protein
MPSRRIEVLTFDGCPNATAADALVERVVADLGAEAEVATVRVTDVDAEQRLRLLGSPTSAWPPNLPDESWLRAALSESAR